MPKKISTIERVKDWRTLPLETLFVVWRYSRGGLSSNEIAELTGVKIHGQTLGVLVETMDYLVKGPVSIPAPIRCNHCGSMLTQLPCYYDQKKPESYRVT